MAYIKAHEIRAKLQSKIDPEVVDVLCKLAESQQEHRQTFRIVAEVVDQMTHQMAVVISAATKLTPEGIKTVLMGEKGSATKQLNAMQESDDDTGSTH